MGLSSQPDLFLLQACSKGDVPAYEEIFSRYSERLYYFALKYTRDADVSEELMMDVMFWIWQNRGKLGSIENLPSYLFRATRNKVFNHLRKAALETLSLDDGHTTLLKDHSFTDQQLELEDMQRQYEKCLDQLSPQCRTVFVMSRQEELTYAEISERLNISVKTVEGHVSAALRSLRKNMPQYPDTLLLFIASTYFL